MQSVPSPTPAAVTPSAPPTPAPAPSSAPDGWAAWSPEAVYTGGDQVLYDGRIYRAKWWTQGEEPGSADVWEDTLASPAPSQTPDALPAASGQPALARPAERPADFKVVGYFPAWKSGQLDCVRYDVLTHVVYAFAIPTAEGGLLPLDNPGAAEALIAAAHGQGVKVLLGVGGWSYNDVPLEAAFVSATETYEKRAAFVGAIVAMCEQYGFDGVDMDWEHPRVDGGSAQQYEDMMLALAGALHGKGKLLTSAVLSGATADGNIYYDAAAHSKKVLDAVDWVNVMAYDGGDGERHSTYEFAVNCGSYWRDTRKLPAEKVVLGLPCYSRPGWAAYRDILDADPGAWRTDAADYNGMTVWYNGLDTVARKTAYAAANLGGVMLWEVTQDTDDLALSIQSAIAAALK